MQKVNSRGDKLRYVSFQIVQPFLDEIDTAIQERKIESRSVLIRHLLFEWLHENDQP